MVGGRRPRHAARLRAAEAQLGMPSSVARRRRPRGRIHRLGPAPPRPGREALGDVSLGLTHRSGSMVLGLPDPWLHVLDAFQEHLDRERRRSPGRGAGGTLPGMLQFTRPGPDGPAHEEERHDDARRGGRDASRPGSHARRSADGGRRMRRRRRPLRLPPAAGSRSSSRPGTSRISSVRDSASASGACSSETDPQLADFDGARVATERNYRATIAVAKGLAAFAAARTREPGPSPARCRPRPGAAPAIRRASAPSPCATCRA